MTWRRMKLAETIFPVHNCQRGNVVMARYCLAGRKDAASADPEDRLPAETLSAEALRLNFEAKGLSAQELIALSGAHTVSPSSYTDLTSVCCDLAHEPSTAAPVPDIGPKLKSAEYWSVLENALSECLVIPL